MSTSQFNEALSHLDAEIEAAKQTLDDLRAKRKGAEFFLEYMSVNGNKTVPASTPATRAATESVLAAVSNRGARPTANGASPTDVVWQTITTSGGQSHTIDEVWKEVRADGHDLSRDQVKNAIHYLVRKNQLTSVRRGLWEVASDPAAPGETGAAETDPSGLGGENTHAQAEADHDRRALDGDDADGRDRGASIAVEF